MKLKILYKDVINGPGVVVTNTIKGLKQDNHQIVELTEKSDFCICLQNPYDFQNFWNEISVIGPNCWLDKNISKTFNKFIVPSYWVKNMYLIDEKFSFLRSQEKNIHIWPTGIDTDHWISSVDKKIKSSKCLLYIKENDSSLIKEALNLIQDFGYEPISIRYGSYSENDLLNACNSVKFCITVTRTESQGFAYMQILSCDVPMFVFDKTVWDDQFPTVFPASSSPYFSKECGEKINRNELYENKKILFEHFIKNINEKKYQPRNFILNNFSLEKSTKNLMNILMMQ